MNKKTQAIIDGIKKLGFEPSVGDDGDVGETEIFITPVGGATSEFFRLEAM